MTRRLFILIVMGLSYVCRADHDSAVDLYNKGDFSAAFFEFKRSAELGVKDAQFNLGAMYYRGEGIERDPVNAYAWMCLSTERPSADQDSRKRLAQKVYAGLESDNKKIADSRCSELILLFGEEALAAKMAPIPATLGASGEAHPLKRVFPSYPRAMLVNGLIGSVDLIYGVGKDGTARDIAVMGFTHKGFVDSAVEALRAWQFEPLRVDGKPVEVYGQIQRIVYVLSRVDFDEQAMLKSVAEAHSKAETGGAIDQFNYANLLEIIPSYFPGAVIGTDINSWYLKSASSGSGRAQFSLGRNLLNGKMCSADSVKGLYWLEKAASRGVADAQYLLAVEMLSGVRVARDDSAAIKWLQRSADARFASAQLRLAWLYATHPDKAFRNGALANTYVGRVSDQVLDQRTYYEVKAAVAAEMARFEDAVYWQNLALAYLKKYELPSVEANERLAAYKAGRAWVEIL